jgi:hypothetical protein
LPALQNESTGFLESLRGSECFADEFETGSGAYPRAPADKTAVTREDISSPVGAFLTQIPKPDSKKFYKRVPPKLFSIYSCGVFLIYSCG